MGLSTVILFIWGRVGVGGYASDKDLCTPGSTGTSPAAFPAVRRLKRMWASVIVEEDCVLGNATSVRSRGEGYTGTTLHWSIPLQFLCCWRAVPRVTAGTVCLKSGAPTALHSARSGQKGHINAAPPPIVVCCWRHRREKEEGWVAGGHCPVPSPGQTCGCSNCEESSPGGFSPPLSIREHQL